MSKIKILVTYQQVFLHESFTIAAPFHSYNRVGHSNFASGEKEKKGLLNILHSNESDETLNVLCTGDTTSIRYWIFK